MCTLKFFALTILLQFTFALSRNLDDCMVPEIENGYATIGRRRLPVSDYVRHDGEIDLHCYKTHEIQSRLPTVERVKKSYCYDGRWSIIINCFPARCFKKDFQLNILQNLGMQTVEEIPDISKSGSNYLLECQTGYEEIKHVEVVTCVYGKWEYPEETSSCVNADSCSQPNDIVNGKVQYEHPFHYGTTISYKCNEGYMLVGLETRHCLDDGTWSGEEPTCEEIDCKPPGIPLNGSILSITGTGLNDEVQYACNIHTTMSGPNTAVCKFDGHVAEWSHSPPTCVSIATTTEKEDEENLYSYEESSEDIGSVTSDGRNCSFDTKGKQLIAYKNGLVVVGDTITVAIGEELTFHCTELGTYIFSGDNKLVCTNEDWNGQKPSCKYINQWDVYSAPTIKIETEPMSKSVDHLGRLEIDEETNVMLSCLWLNSYGDPKWEFKGNRIKFSNSYEERKSNEYHLHINKITKEQAGHYTCRNPYRKANTVIINVVENVKGRITSQTITATTAKILQISSTSKTSARTTTETAEFSTTRTTTPRPLVDSSTMNYTRLTTAEKPSLRDHPCLAKDYSYLDVFVNGKQLREKYEYFHRGTYVTFRCQNDQLLKFEGVPKISCNHGMWSAPWPRCIFTRADDRDKSPPVRVLSSTPPVRLDNGEYVIKKNVEVFYFTCGFTKEKPRILYNGLDFERIHQSTGIDYSPHQGYFIRLKGSRQPKKSILSCVIPRNPDIFNSITVREGDICYPPEQKAYVDWSATIHPAFHQSKYAEGDVIMLKCERHVRKWKKIPSSLICSANGVWITGKGEMSC